MTPEPAAVGIGPRPDPRPPGIESQRCEAVDRCGNFANWALPEYPVCHSHTATAMPPELWAVAARRREAWMVQGAEVWARILAEFPLPE